MKLNNVEKTIEKKKSVFVSNIEINKKFIKTFNANNMEVICFCQK